MGFGVSNPVASESNWPIPARTSETSFFWDGIDADELRIQRCIGCGRLRHPPRPACPTCGSLDWDYVVVDGTGELYSYAVHHRPAVPGPSLPYVSAIVALSVGVRMLSNIVTPNVDELAIGLPVRVVFRTVRPGLRLPLFEVVSTTRS